MSTPADDSGSINVDLPSKNNNFVTKQPQTNSNSDKADAVHILVLEKDEPHPEPKDVKAPSARSSMTSYRSRLQTPAAALSFIYDAHGNDAWILRLLDLLKELWTTRPKVLFSGVCFGHQLLSRLLGAHTEPTPGGRWELAHREMVLNPIGQKLFRTNTSKLSLHQMHQDQVTSVPSTSTTNLLSQGQKVHVWASTPIQGLYIRDRLFTSQGHSGFDEKMVYRQIEMREENGGIKDNEHAAEAKETGHLKHDGVVVASAILPFFHGDDHDID